MSSKSPTDTAEERPDEHVYQTRGNPNVYHYYRDCPYFPENVEMVSLAEAKRLRRCCSHCRKKKLFGDA